MFMHTGMNIIRTDRLELIPASGEIIELLIAGEYARAGNLLNAIVPSGWPHDEAASAGLPIHLQAMRGDERETLWRIRLLVIRKSREVAGAINLKGPPRGNGDVEIGWGVNEEHRGQGLAVEGSGAVIGWVFSQAGARRVIATIPGDHLASVGVARRLGMSPTEGTKRGLPVWAMTKEATPAFGGRS